MFMETTSLSGFSNAGGRLALDERGLTLLEVTLMLLVSVAVLGALMPVVADTVRHGEVARATTDMEHIRDAMLNALTEMVRTNFTIDGTAGGTIVKQLVSDGDVLRESAGAGSPTWRRVVGFVAAGGGFWTDFLERHLVTNTPIGGGSYPTVAAWRGAYLNAPIDPDPWGNRYTVNSEFFGASTNDVVVLSSGPNETGETAFSANPLAAGGDDILVLVES